MQRHIYKNVIHAFGKALAIDFLLVLFFLFAYLTIAFVMSQINGPSGVIIGLGQGPHGEQFTCIGFWHEGYCNFSDAVKSYFSLFPFFFLGGIQVFFFPWGNSVDIFYAPFNYTLILLLSALFFRYPMCLKKLKAYVWRKIKK